MIFKSGDGWTDGSKGKDKMAQDPEINKDKAIVLRMNEAPPIVR
jgi:hypothetical protein